jgi:hypothetical protein
METKTGIHNNLSKELSFKVKERDQTKNVWNHVVERPANLLDLRSFTAWKKLREYKQMGVQPIPIEKIKGGVSRCQDFDSEFNPITHHSGWRWLGISFAKRSGEYLPPIDVVQVGDVYFVKDGYHRVSVAKAMGERFIDASVTVMEFKR